MIHSNFANFGFNILEISDLGLQGVKFSIYPLTLLIIVTAQPVMMHILWDYVTVCGFPLIPGSGRYVG